MRAYRCALREGELLATEDERRERGEGCAAADVQLGGEAHIVIRHVRRVPVVAAQLAVDRCRVHNLTRVTKVRVGG